LEEKKNEVSYYESKIFNNNPPEKHFQVKEEEPEKKRKCR